MDLATLKRNYFKYVGRRIYDKITYYDHRTGKKRIRYVLSNKIKLYNLYRGVYLKKYFNMCSITLTDFCLISTIILDININWTLLKKIYFILIRLNLHEQIIFDIIKYNLPIFSFRVLAKNKEQNKKFLTTIMIKDKWKNRLY